MNEEQNYQWRHRSRVPVLFAILLIVLMIIGWHFLAPILGLSLVFTGALGGAVMSSMVILCVSIVLFLIFSGIGILILGIFSVLWTMVAVALFPILFPFLAPIVIVLVLIGYLLGRRQ